MDLEISKDFSKVIGYITNARENALRKVNEELIMLYWNVGAYISDEMKSQN